MSKEKISKIINEISKAITGKEEIIKRVLTVILAKGHVLLEDIPGVGKTTLAYILANEMGSKVKVTSGPSIERSGRGT